MGEIREQVAYLKGLAEGLNVGESAEGKLIVKMFDVLDSIADAFDDVDDEIEELEEYIEAVDEDLRMMTATAASAIRTTMIATAMMMNRKFLKSSALPAEKPSTLLPI